MIGINLIALIQDKFKKKENSMYGLLHKILKSYIRKGRLDIIFPDGKYKTYGQHQNSDFVTIKLVTADICYRLIINPSLAFGEGYMEGTIQPVNCSIYQVLNVLMSNDLQQDHFGEKISSALRFCKRSWAQFNPARKSRKNVAHHYDLREDLYRLFLDKDMQYSCGYFKNGDETLEEAQYAKKKHIAAKLLLNRPDLEILDIGSGWGGMALYLAKEYQAKVLGITLSEEQLRVSRKRAKEEGLEDRVQFRMLDYRSIKGKFDRIVSVGMFEHVGVHYYQDFFSTVYRILKPDGIMLLHSIGRSDGPGSTNAWINRYIFPGGYSPALSEVFPYIEKNHLWVTDCEILRLHYAKTIHFWRERFEAKKEEVIKLYDKRFYRMFEMYLAASELVFYYHCHMNFQLQLSPSIDALPITRNYMMD